MTTEVPETPAEPTIRPGGTPLLNKALAAFQAEMPKITKGETGKIEGKSQTTGMPFSYSYNYADLAAINAVAGPLLGKHGLAFSSRPTLVDGKFCLAYELRHSSGEQVDGVMPLPSSGKPQDLGTLLTYYRRYAMCAVCNIAPAGEDNDASSANHEQRFDTRSAGAAFDQAEPVAARNRGQQNGNRQPAAPAVELAPLAIDDPWRDRIADIADKDEGIRVYGEVAELLRNQQIGEPRAKILGAHIAARVTNVEFAARSAAPGQQPPTRPAAGQPDPVLTGEVDPWQTPPPAGTGNGGHPRIRQEDQGAHAAARPAPKGEDDAEFVTGFTARVADAEEARDQTAMSALLREIGMSIGQGKVTPRTGGELADLVRGKLTALKAAA